MLPVEPGAAEAQTDPVSEEADILDRVFVRIFRMDSLAGREMNIGRYNMQKRNYTGAINRFKTVVTQYQTTRHVEEALARLTEAYMAIGIVTEAQTAAAVLGHNFPDSPWYKDAYNLVRSGGVEPSENQGSYISKAFKKLGLG